MAFIVLQFNNNKMSASSSSANNNDTAVLLIVYNVITCVIMILLGFLQKRHLDRFSKSAIAVACLNGLCAVLLYSKTDFFPSAAAGLVANLLIHGAMIHFPLNECHLAVAVVESSYMFSTCPAFRCRCVCNHETWILVAVTAGVVSALGM